MDLDKKKLGQVLSHLDKKAEAIEAMAKEIRIEINNFFWEFVKAKEDKDGRKCI